MPNLEQMHGSENQPRFNNISEIAEAENSNQLSPEELLLELAKQKYINNYGTIELMQQLKNQPPETAQKLKKLIQIVALSDLADEDINEALAGKTDKTYILEQLQLIKNFKQEITH